MAEALTFRRIWSIRSRATAPVRSEQEVVGEGGEAAGRTSGIGFGEESPVAEEGSICGD